MRLATGIGALKRLVLVLLVGVAVLGAHSLVATRASSPSQAADETNRGTNSGLAIPRFVSLKTDRVNVRRGPSRDHEVLWVFTRTGLPVEIIAESDNWRRIRDVDGSEGWVLHSLLSGRRTVLVAPWEKAATLDLRSARAADAPVRAHLASGVLAQVKSCGGGWCRLSGNRFDGWIQQDRLWGVYPDELIE